jgi:hypothetical protein
LGALLLQHGAHKAAKIELDAEFSVLDAADAMLYDSLPVATDFFSSYNANASAHPMAPRPVTHKSTNTIGCQTLISLGSMPINDALATIAVQQVNPPATSMLSNGLYAI